jgi:hypothetical protein
MGKSLFVMLVGKEKNSHAGKCQQKHDGEKHLFQGKMGMPFQMITL